MSRYVPAPPHPVAGIAALGLAVIILTASLSLVRDHVSSARPERNTRSGGSYLSAYVPLRRPRRLVVPPAIRDSIASRVEAAHPEEAGGFLCCDREGDTLHVTEHVPLANEADDPRRRFLTTEPPALVPRPRVFYHSHTAATAPSDLTATDRANIPDPLALVVFAPHGTPYSYRLFRRGAFNWRELPVLADGEHGERLPRLY